MKITTALLKQYISACYAIISKYIQFTFFFFLMDATFIKAEVDTKLEKYCTEIKI